MSTLVDALIAHQIDLMRVDATARNHVLEVLNKLGRQLEVELQAGPDLTDARRAAVNTLLNQIGSTIDSYYSEVHGYMSDVLTQVSRIEAQNTLVVSIDASLPTQGHLKAIASDALIKGAPSADWWDRQEKDTVFRFSQAVREGVAAGETNSQIVARIRGTALDPGIMDISRRNAEALIRTSVAAIASQARIESYRANSDIIYGVKQVSTLDSRTTDICIAYSEGEWDLDGQPINGTTLPFNGGPPRHWNCRSVLVPLMREDVLGFDISKGRTRASVNGPISDKVTFDDWLSRQPVEVQNEMLGKGRAQLWRDGKITLRDLLDQRGNPLTLSQLEERVGQRVSAIGQRVDEGVQSATPGIASFRARRIQIVEQALRELGMEDSIKVTYHSGSGPLFKTGTKTWRTAAYFRPGPEGEGSLGFYIDTSDSMGLPATVRHEAFHARFWKARYESYSGESSVIPSHPSAPAGFRKEYEKAFNKVDQFLLEKKFDLIREDGTTPYSKSYWKAWESDRFSWRAFESAVNESLAEMHATKQLTPTYQQLDDMVSELNGIKPIRYPVQGLPREVPEPSQLPKIEPPQPKQPPPVPIQPGMTLSLERICLDIGMDTKTARRILRNAGIQKPGDFWVWPNPEAAQDVIKLLRSKVKVRI